MGGCTQPTVRIQLLYFSAIIPVGGCIKPTVRYLEVGTRHWFVLAVVLYMGY